MSEVDNLLGQIANETKKEEKKGFSWTTYCVPVALGVSLALNITALVIPFMSFTIMGKTETYSVPHTVKKMWDEKLKGLAVLITCFSIIWPLVKLTSLTIIWFAQPFTGEFREKFLRVMTELGRWSLLDVFAALILASLASGQKAFTVELHGGLSLFLGAIMINMATGELMHHLQKNCNEKELAKLTIERDLELADAR